MFQADAMRRSGNVSGRKEQRRFMRLAQFMRPNEKGTAPPSLRDRFAKVVRIELTLRCLLALTARTQRSAIADYSE
jgi:hypothetical protein